MSVKQEPTRLIQYIGKEAVAFGGFGAEPGKTYEVPDSQAKRLLATKLFKVAVDAKPAEEK